MSEPYDAVLVISFGGPEKMEDVRPFLSNVLRGRPAPPERIETVVHHYELLGGKSPLNELTFRQAAGLRTQLAVEGSPLPVFVGMRNWHPFFVETMREMARARVKHAVGVILAAQQSEAGWDRYMQEVIAARAEIPGAPEVSFVPGWHAHPLFIAAMASRLGDALSELDESERQTARVIFTAHSIPVRAAADSPYVSQIEEGACRVSAACGVTNMRVAYQSRSGSPRDPWLDPDICEVVREEAAAGTKTLVVVPIGFVCDHVEVLYDLDIEAKAIADDLGVRFVRAKTVNDHPDFIRMLADVVRTHVGQS